MLFLDKLSSNYRMLLIGVFGSIVAGAILRMYTQEFFWWAAGLLSSVFLNVFLFHWAINMKQTGKLQSRLTSVREEEIERITADSLNKAMQIESLNEEKKRLQEKLDEHYSKLVPPSEPENSPLKFVNMVHCKPINSDHYSYRVIITLTHTLDRFSDDSGQLSRLALTPLDTRHLCYELAKILRWPFATTEEDN